MIADKVPDCTICPTRGKSIFCSLKPAELVSVNENKDFHKYHKGQVVFEQGGRPGHVYCIRQGKIKIHQLGNEGKDQIVRLAGEGDIVGYRALVSGENYSCSATVLEDSVVCSLSRDAFLDLLESNPKVSFNLMNILSHDLQNAEHRITDIAQKSVRERLAESILFLKNRYGFEEDGLTLAVVLSREELSNLVGTARETVIRILSDLKEEKIIDLVGKKIKLLNIPELIRIANVFD